MPSVPTALARTEMSMTALSADITPFIALLAITSKARVFSASPASSAIFSGNAL